MWTEEDDPVKDHSSKEYDQREARQPVNEESKGVKQGREHTQFSTRW